MKSLAALGILLIVIGCTPNEADPITSTEPEAPQLSGLDGKILGDWDGTLEMAEPEEGSRMPINVPTEGMGGNTLNLTYESEQRRFLLSTYGIEIKGVWEVYDTNLTLTPEDEESVADYFFNEDSKIVLIIEEAGDSISWPSDDGSNILFTRPVTEPEAE
jgi:hypothetical protein